MDAIHPSCDRSDGILQRAAARDSRRPVNLTIINEGARSGRKWAMLITLGATTMEVTYCFIAFTGLASFLLAALT